MQNNIKQIIRTCIPPILLSNRHNKPRVYSTYEQAALECGAGYSERDLVAAVVEKNIRLRDSLAGGVKRVEMSAARTAMGVALAAYSDRMNVIDFGGGAGFHYFIAQALFGHRVKFRWNVVETAALVNEAQRIETADLKFFVDASNAFDNLGAVDLAFSSGALQYLPDPIVALNDLLAINAKHLFLTRIGLTETAKKTTVQESWLRDNGPGPLPTGYPDRLLRYPATFVNKDEFERVISAKYDIRTVFHEDRSAYRAGNEAINMYGYYATRRG